MKNDAKFMGQNFFTQLKSHAKIRTGTYIEHFVQVSVIQQKVPQEPSRLGSSPRGCCFQARASAVRVGRAAGRLGAVETKQK
jgi:hypothetical protein